MYVIQARKYIHRGAPDSQARYHHRDLVVPSPHVCLQEREG